MQKLLLQKSTGAVYPWNKELAKRNDMIDYKPEPKTDKVALTEVQTMAKAVLTKKGKVDEAKVDETKVEG